MSPTWFPPDKIEVSGNLVYLVFKSPDTHYTSGQEVSFDTGRRVQVADRK